MLVVVVVALVVVLVVVASSETELRAVTNGVTTATQSKRNINNPQTNANRQRRGVMDDRSLFFILLITKITQNTPKTIENNIRKHTDNLRFDSDRIFEHE